MELRHLRYIIAVADELNFGRAAIRLHISQPPLSHQVRQFETELGVAIFHRTKRRVRLTEPGAVIVEEARRIVDQCDHLKRVAARAGRGELGRLSIGVPRLERTIPVEALHAFAERNPAVALEVACLDATEQLQGLHNGSLDVGFLRLPLSDETLASEVIQRTPLVAALPVDHPLAAHHHLALAAFSGYPFIHFKRSTNPAYHDQLMAIWRKANFEPVITHEVSEPFAALSLVEAGLGVTIVPAFVHDLKRNGVVFRKLRPELEVETGVVYSPDNDSSVLAAFLKLVRDVAAKHAAQPSADQSRSTAARGKLKRPEVRG